MLPRVGMSDAFAARVAAGAEVARVAGTTYLHLVSAVDHANARVQISNNRGRVNGWTGHARVFGICTAVGGVARPGAAAKRVGADGEVTRSAES